MSDKAFFLFLEYARQYHTGHFHGRTFEECQYDVCRIAREEATELASLRSALAEARECMEVPVAMWRDMGKPTSGNFTVPASQLAKWAAALAALPAVRKE